MSAQRVWIEIVLCVSTFACGLALTLATLGAAAGAAMDVFVPEQTAQAAAEPNYEGMVTCSRCGARHSSAMGKSAADCVRTCVHQEAAFVLVDGDETYILQSRLDVLKQFAGKRARVAGQLSGKTITVSSITFPDGGTE